MMAHPQTKCSTHNWAKEMRQRERKQEYELPEEPKFVNLKKRPTTDNDPLTNVLQQTFPPTDRAFHMLTAYPNSYYGTSRGSSSSHSSGSHGSSSYSGSSVGSHSSGSAATYIESNMKPQNNGKNSASKSGNRNDSNKNHHTGNFSFTSNQESNHARNRIKATKSSEGGWSSGYYQRNISDKHRSSNFDSKLNRETTTEGIMKINCEQDFDRTKRRRALDEKLIKLYNVPTFKGRLFDSTKRAFKSEICEKHTQNKNRPSIPTNSQISLTATTIESRELCENDETKKKAENNPWLLENYLPHKKASNEDKYKAPSKNMDATKKLSEEANHITNDVNHQSQTSNNHKQKLETTSTSTFANRTSPNQSETFFNHGSSGSLNEVTLQPPNQPKGPKHPRSYDERIKPKAVPLRTPHRSEQSKKNTSKRRSAKDTRRPQHRVESNKNYINTSNFIRSPSNPDSQDSPIRSSDQDHSEDNEDFMKSSQKIFRDEKPSAKSSQLPTKYPRGSKHQKDPSTSAATTYEYMEAKTSKQESRKRKMARESSSSSKHFKPDDQLPSDNTSCWFCPLKVTIHSSRRCKSKKKSKKMKLERKRPITEEKFRNNSKRLSHQHEQSPPSTSHQSNPTQMSPPIIRKANHVTVCPASTSQASQQHLKRKCVASPQATNEHSINHSFYAADGISSPSVYNQYKKRGKSSISPTNQQKRNGNNAVGNEEQFCSSQSRRNFCQDNSKFNEAYQQPSEFNSCENVKRRELLSRGNTVVSEPDSSWPEQERLMRSDDYSKEGIRLKHEADAFDTNSRLEGSALRRGLLYFEASLMFTMNGHMIEIENEKGLENGSSNKRSSSAASANLYGQTILLYEHIRKSKEDQHTLDFRRLIISCLRAEALLHLRIYNLKKDLGNKNLELLLDQCKNVQANRTPSPWRPNQAGSNQQTNNSMLSPSSPAVPSPYGSVVVAGPSPAAGSTCSGASEHVSSSTQVGKSISSPSTNNSVFSTKSFEYFRQYQLVIHHITHSHTLWDRSTKLLAEDRDFFGAVETLSGITLTLHTSLRDMVTYFKAVLRQLRVKSPKE